MKDRPPNVTLDFVRPLDKPVGGAEYFVSVIFKCKRNCKTIFTRDNILEMDRFAAEFTRHPQWFQECARDKNGKSIDGVGCGKSAYANMTSELIRATQLSESTT